jgi:hypothetical protein
VAVTRVDQHLSHIQTFDLPPPTLHTYKSAAGTISGDEISGNFEQDFFDPAGKPTNVHRSGMFTAMRLVVEPL